MDLIIRTLFLGVFATAAIDIWATFSNKVLKLPRTNWAMVGRWLGHIPSGKIIHHPIGSSVPINYELALGWAFHYLIGITYAALYVAFVAMALSGTSTLASALIFGAITILSPWFVMQPGLGLGICATKASRPNLVRLQNFLTHSIFGGALYYGWALVDTVL